MVAKVLALVLVLFLAACQTTNADSCAGFEPIRPSQADISVISSGLVDDILIHNQTGAKLCGWKS